MNEAYIGAKHKRGANFPQKMPTVAMVEIGGRVVVKANISLRRVNLINMIKSYVNTEKPLLITDGWKGYNSASSIVPHATI